MKIITLFILSTLVSCGVGGAKGPLNFGIKIDETVRAEEVDFKILQKQILPKCIGCHQNWTTEDAIAKMITPGKPDESQFFDSVKAGRMPKRSSPLNSAQLEIVRNYILNIRVTVPVPVPDETAYQELHSKVFSVSCLPCHAKTLNDEAVLIEKWIDKTSPENSKLLVETESGRMPKKGPALTPEQLDIIRKYVSKFR